MASLPTYDPNDLSGLKNTAVLSNPLVEHVYEMGSIIKPLTMSVGLDTGAINVNSTYEDTGTMELSGKKISNYDGKARGKTDMQQILSQSLNVGVATISLLVGKQDFAKYFGDFGFGDKTGVDEPNEATGIVNNLKTGRDVEIATASYGQGVAFSPMATVRGLAILANGGYLVTPHIVKEIAYEDGTMKSIPVTKTGPVLKKQTVDDVTGMLVKVVDDALLKGEIKNAHYKVAAKTGTAQIADHVNGGYYSDKYLHSFFGYFPATKPQYIVFLYQINPKGAEYASATLTKPFDEITKFLINYYDIPPDR
jgi:cell division protein FtsI (penicillin-binding protein 3)/stage V sporulation protein D (sporulation-specific penicillin-binding protein)